MPAISSLFDQLVAQGSHWLLLFIVLLQPISLRLAPPARRRPALIALFIGLIHVVLVGVLALDPGQTASNEMRFAIAVAGRACWIFGIGHLTFDVLFARLGILRPVIIRDLSILALVGISAILSASQAGFAVSGVIATSAVLTAVIGLSLQDTLGNLIGGISLQLDSSLTVGDWIRVGDLKGRVVQIGWRCTTIETNDWETILLPNSVLMRGSVVILARRSGAEAQWRRWVRFNAPLTVPPARVIGLVEAALKESVIPHLGADPVPSCICTGVDHGCAAFAVRYWLTDPLHDDSTDSRVRSVVLASLAREGIALAMPVQGIAVQRDGHSGEREAAARLDLVQGIGLFTLLTEDERQILAEAMVEWPVATGERLVKSGESGDSLFIVASGKFSVELNGQADTRIGVARLGRGTLIGEMSLLTGEPRSATVVALTDSLTYRLDRRSFQRLILKRPEIVDELSRMFSARQESNLNAQREAERMLEGADGIGHGSRLLHRMRDWLGGAEPVKPAQPPPLVEMPGKTLVGTTSPFYRG